MKLKDLKMDFGKVPVLAAIENKRAALKWEYNILQDKYNNLIDTGVLLDKSTVLHSKLDSSDVVETPIIQIRGYKRQKIEYTTPRYIIKTSDNEKLIKRVIKDRLRQDIINKLLRKIE